MQIVSGGASVDPKLCPSLLASILDGSEDAIVSKTLDGRILTWSPGAERLFGHSTGEAVGKPISMLIPDDRQAEEEEIIEAVRLGHRYQKSETVRLTKNGDLIDLSVIVSPIRASDGHIVGATKIARDITPQREAERQSLLARELNHRIKNLFALTTSLVAQSAREALTVAELEVGLTARLVALARAHDLMLPDLGVTTPEHVSPTLQSLLAAILAPYRNGSVARVDLTGDDVDIGPRTLTTLALVLHELATNAVKYGALSASTGHLKIEVSVRGDEVGLVWTERGGPAPVPYGGSKGFGSHLERACLRGMASTISRDWMPEGLIVKLAIPVERIRT